MVILCRLTGPAFFHPPATLVLGLYTGAVTRSFSAGAGDLNSGPMIAKQALALLSHHPSPKFFIHTLF